MQHRNPLRWYRLIAEWITQPSQRQPLQAPLHRLRPMLVLRTPQGLKGRQLREHVLLNAVQELIGCSDGIGKHNDGRRNRSGGVRVATLTGYAVPQPLAYEPMADHPLRPMDQPSTQDSDGDLQAQLLQARKEAELTLDQLHLVQEELEHYFLANEGAEAKLQRYVQEQQRAEAVIDTLLARLEARGAA